MGARLSQDERRAVAQRIFEALCAHYPEHYVALIESEVGASSPERASTRQSAGSNEDPAAVRKGTNRIPRALEQTQRGHSSMDAILP